MKKILFAIAFVTMMTISASAQIDGFFDADYTFWDEYRIIGGGVPQIPYDATIGVLGGDIPAPVPVGSGLLVLTALGAGYAVAKKKKKSF
ncbi:MAG: hypothetical protein J6T53_01945 [Bacteroidales bacterium]|nr:hypothetical protein [Bacteroidales bacterium]